VPDWPCRTGNRAGTTPVSAEGRWLVVSGEWSAARWGGLAPRSVGVSRGRQPSPLRTAEATPIYSSFRRLVPARSGTPIIDLGPAALGRWLPRSWLRSMYTVARSGVGREQHGARVRQSRGAGGRIRQDGRALEGSRLPGIGHVELGTVTPEPPAGEPRPRSSAGRGRGLINRMGFPNAADWPDGCAGADGRLGRTAQLVVGSTWARAGTPLRKRPVTIGAVGPSTRWRTTWS
jgi:hypothetical protein